MFHYDIALITQNFRLRGEDEYNDPNLYHDSSESSEDSDADKQCTEVIFAF